MSASPRPAWLAAAALLAVPATALVFLLFHGSPAPRSEPRSPAEPPPSLDTAHPSASTRSLPDDEAAITSPGRADARRKVDDARSRARSDPKRRRALLREALALDPKYEPALQDLSLAMLEDENHDEARAVSARCLAVSPDNETCRMVSNYALPRSPEADTVGRDALSCLDATPKAPKCLATGIGYDVLTGKIDEATRLAETLDGVAPGAKQTLFAKARLASVAGHYDDARHDLEDACRQGLEQACFRAEALREEGW